MKWYAILVALFLATQSTGAVARNGFLSMQVLRDNFIRGFLQQLDPLNLNGPYDLNIDEEQLKVHGSVDSLTINGLSEFSVDHWRVDAATSKIEFALNLAKLAANGHYNGNGRLINFFPIQGSGNFNFDVKNIRVSGTIEVDQSNERDIAVKGLVLDIQFGSSAIKLENEAHESNDMVNEILSVVMVDFYYQYENTIKSEISKAVEHVINQYLDANKYFHAIILNNILPTQQVEPEATPRVSINGIVDGIFSSIRISATEGGWDPIGLPSDDDEFSVSLFGATLNGKVAISNARLGGFSTIHRTGPCTTTPRPNKTEAVVYVGGNDIELGLDFMWSAGIFRANLQIELIVRHVDLKIGVTIDTENPSITLSEFLLNEIGTVKITIGGIPGGGSDIISNRLSLLSNLVKDSLIYAFQEALRPFAEKVITDPVVAGILVEKLSFQ